MPRVFNRTVSIYMPLAIAMFLSYGCATEGYRVDLKPEQAQTAAKAAKGKYFIASFHYEKSANIAISAGDLTANDINVFNPDTTKDSPDKIEKLRQVLQATGRARYPAIFAADGEQAIPIEVMIKASKGDEQMIGPMLCGFTLGVVPGPFSLEHIYEINVVPYPPAGAAESFKKVCYTQAGSAALFPTGLIGSFSETDDPPMRYMLGNTAPYIQMIQKRTLGLFSDAIVMELVARQAEFAGVPTIAAGQESVVFRPSGGVGSGKLPVVPGGGIVAPQQHEEPSQSNGLAL